MKCTFEDCKIYDKCEFRKDQMVPLDDCIIASNREKIPVFPEGARLFISAYSPIIAKLV